MAVRRMFSKVITNSDLFLDMPLTSQLLYFHLGMNADDDGFVQLRSTMRSIGSTDDDARILFAKNLLIQFRDGVVVIKDWRVHNEIRTDRYKPTIYTRHLEMLALSDVGCYMLKNPDVGLTVQNPLVVPNDNQMPTQVRLGKVRLGKVREERDTLSSKEYLKHLPEDDTSYFTGKYNITINQLKHKAEELLNYLDAHGKKYKNYKAFLENAVRRDFGYKVVLDSSKFQDLPRNEANLERLAEIRSKVFSKGVIGNG